MRKGLFGGAISGVIPETYSDISAVRDVPDNQECFAEQDTDTSIIVEIVEMEDESLEYFFNDIAEANGSSETTIEYVERTMPCVSSAIPGSSVGLIVGTLKVAKFQEQAENRVRLYLSAIRLPQYKTDILISLNAPVVINPASSSATAVVQSNIAEKQMTEKRILNQFLESFQIVDPTVFG